jgi:quinoprotein glucose dehydrogenase
MHRAAKATLAAAAALLTTGVIQPLPAQSRAGKRADGDWPTFNRDLAATRYSPLTQINTRNVARLKLAWSYRPGEKGGSAGAEVTPLVINGVMYLPAGNLVVALEPETGREIWRYRVSEGLVANDRGVSYWPGDRQNPPRIFFTAGAGGLPTFTKLIALNARTGRIDPGFGREGEVDMVVGYRSAPTIFKNVVMVGSYAQEHEALGIPGDSRAYDARTGAKLWEFHSVPRPGEAGHETWQGDSWQKRSGTNMWGVQAAVDEQLGIVYMMFGAPASTYYGGDRQGDNLFGNSVVAIDAQTGQYKWHFQTIHHDIWDYDLPPAPSLIDIVQNGKRIPALVQAGKTGFLYILDRVTGQPVFGVEERAVPAADVPGEWYSPTQPFPVKPPALARLTFSPEDLVTEADTNAEHAKACRDLLARSGEILPASIFTPWPFRPEGAPARSIISFPGFNGGANWGGTAIDPRSSMIYVFTQDLGNLGWIQPYPDGFREPRFNEINTLPYDRGSEAGPGPNQRFSVAMQGQDGKPTAGGPWPCQKPPWGRLNAVNANTGEIVWQTTVGITDDLPEAKRNTGRPGNAGPMVTAGGLVFLGATNDARFRAFDAKTGKELWTTQLDYSANAIPITYRGKNGRQYVAVTAAGVPAAGAAPDGQALMVYSLPY